MSKGLKLVYWLPQLRARVLVQIINTTRPIEPNACAYSAVEGVIE